MLLLDNTARKVPIATVMVVTPYLKGLVEAQCLPDAIYDLIIGNVLELDLHMNQTQLGKKHAL